MERHPPRHAPLEGALLVLREVAATPRAEEEHDLVEHVPRLRRAGGLDRRRTPGATEDGHEARGQLPCRRDDVDEPRCDGAAGHAVELGRGGLLHEHDAAGLLHVPEPEGSVRPHPRQDHRHGGGSLILRESAQEPVDGEA